MKNTTHEKTFSPEIIENPKGYVVLKLEHEAIKIDLDFNAMCDADQHLGKSAISCFVDDPMNLQTLRVLFYYGIKEHRSGINSLRDAGNLLKGLTLDVISNAIVSAMEVSGVMKPEDAAELEAAGVAIDGEAPGKK